MILQSGGAIAIGGTMSFAFVILVPTSLIAALVLSQRDWIQLLTIPVVAISATAVAQLAGLDTLPTAFHHQVESNHPVLIICTALTLTIALVVGGILGRMAQQAALSSERKAAEATSELATTLQHQNQQLFGLTGAIAHELKNPLTASRGSRG